MTAEELREEAGIELELLENIVRELASLHSDVGTREPSVREKTTAAAFMAQFYGAFMMDTMRDVATKPQM